MRQRAIFFYVDMHVFVDVYEYEQGMGLFYVEVCYFISCSISIFCCMICAHIMY
jgi:hypothetical protein